MTASKLTQQQTIINALQRGDWEVLAHLTDYELHDLEFAAEVWNAGVARNVILAELDNRDVTAQQMVDLIQKAQTSAGIRVPLRLQGIEGRYVGQGELVNVSIGKSKGCTWDELMNRSARMTNCVDEKAPTRPATPFSIIAAMHALPPTYSNILEALHERQQAERHERHLIALGMPARRPGLNSVREAVALIEATIADPVKLDAESWAGLKKPRAAIPIYLRALKAERQRLLKAHGYRIVRDENGQHWVSPRSVPLKVRRRLAKLARMIDMAAGRKPWPVQAYHYDLQCRAPGVSNRTLERWLNNINPV